MGRLSEAEILASRFGRAGGRVITIGAARPFLVDAAEIPEMPRLSGRAELAVRINGEAYQAEVREHSIRLVNARGQACVVSFGRPGKDDRCDCEDFRRHGDECQHIGALRAVRLIPAARRMARVTESEPINLESERSKTTKELF